MKVQLVTPYRVNHGVTARGNVTSVDSSLRFPPDELLVSTSELGTPSSLKRRNTECDTRM